MSYTKSGIYLPPLPEPRPNGKRRKTSLMMGIGALVNPDGTIAWQEDDWTYNALQDAGEQAMLQVFLQEAAHPTKYLALLNQGGLTNDPAETVGTMAGVTETKTPATNGYNRIIVNSGDWTNDGLISGDYRFSASEKTFGAAATSAWTIDHVVLTTTLTSSAALLLAFLRLQAVTTVAIGQFWKQIFRWAQQ